MKRERMWYRIGEEQRECDLYTILQKSVIFEEGIAHAAIAIICDVETGKFMELNPIFLIKSKIKS